MCTGQRKMITVTLKGNDTLLSLAYPFTTHLFFPFFLCSAAYLLSPRSATFFIVCLKEYKNLGKLQYLGISTRCKKNQVSHSQRTGILHLKFCNLWTTKASCRANPNPLDIYHTRQLFQETPHFGPHQNLYSTTT